MATRNIVPRATGEGSIGTSAKTWSAVYANDIAVTNGVSASMFTGNLTGTASGNLASSGGTMTGSINYVETGKVFSIGNTDPGSVNLGWNWANRAGAGLGLRNTNYPSPGEFTLFARNANNTYSLTGKPDGTLTWNNQPLLPVGIVQAFAGSTIPTGWLLCDGSAVSRTTYAKLFSVIGTTYGSGNGSTTFNLPNLVDKFVEGSATAGTVKSAGLPNITGRGWNIGGRNISDWSGAFKQTAVAPMEQLPSGSSNGGGWIDFNASLSNSIYGNSTTVQPPALTMRYIIKY